MAIKLRTVVKHPATVEGGTGIVVTKENGTYTYDIDFTEFVEADTIPDASVAFVPFYTAGAGADDPDVYERISLEEIATLAADELGATAFILTLFDDADAASARTTLGAQAQDADLDALAANSTNGFWARTGAGTGSARTFAASTGLAWTNPAGTAGNPSINYDFQNLTLDASPDSANDFLVSYDASAGAFKKVTVGAVGSAGSVSDFNTRTGSATGYYPGTVENFAIACSAAASALTIALKDAAGSDPSVSSPVTAILRNATLATGTPQVRRATAALSLVIPSGAEVGAENNTPFNLVVALVDDGGTLRLAVKNTSKNGIIYPVSSTGFLTSTTIGTGSDSAGVWYSDTGVTDKPYVLLGRLVYGANPLATKGTWATAPDIIELKHADFRYPGDLLQSIPTTLTTFLSAGTTVVPRDGTIPQQSETNAVLSQAITPLGHANWISARGQVHAEYTAASWVIAALFRDSTGDALSVTPDFITGTSTGRAISVSASVLASSTAATTLKLNGAGVNAGTFMANGDTATTYFGAGTITSLIVEEYQG